jgi:hypothetical protein
MDAGQLASDGDMIKIRARFKATGSTTNKECYIYLGASPLLTFSNMSGSNVTYTEIEATITRTGATSGKVDGKCLLGTTGTLLLNPVYFSEGVFSFPLATITPTWANAIDVEVWADDNGSSAITCELFQVTYYKA